ncbi:MAG: hypothetical protein F6K17_42460 [Okeania sp. SIO3C4]|nr:hypothetical protein [Okeania sp. SIO3B3]NER08724.1 hypothetical protein [Okeania sp. SIO3C4]
MFIHYSKLYHVRIRARSKNFLPSNLFFPSAPAALLPLKCKYPTEHDIAEERRKKEEGRRKKEEPCVILVLSF